MRMLDLEIDERVAGMFPEVAVGGFLVEELPRAAGRLGGAGDLARAARAELERQGITAAALPAEPRIAAWRAAVRAMGLKAASFRSSPEQLARRLLGGGTLSTPLPVVTAYCAVSARHLAPLGGYDLDRLPQGRVTLRPGRPDHDRFAPLGARPEAMPVTPAVVVYASGDTVICWAFNCRDSRETGLAEGTGSALFLGEAVAAVQRGALAAAVGELAGLLRGHGARVGEPCFADAAAPRARLAV